MQPIFSKENAMSKFVKSIIRLIVMLMTWIIFPFFVILEWAFSNQNLREAIKETKESNDLFLKVDE